MLLVTPFPEPGITQDGDPVALPLSLQSWRPGLLTTVQALALIPLGLAMLGGSLWVASISPLPTCHTGQVGASYQVGGPGPAHSCVG